jgi:hypothetical protein
MGGGIGVKGQGDDCVFDRSFYIVVISSVRRLSFRGSVSRNPDLATGWRVLSVMMGHLPLI